VTSAHASSSLSHWEIGLASLGHIDYLEHARRTMVRARTIANAIDDYDVIGGEAQVHIQNGGRAEWMYRSARLVLWQVALGRVAHDSPCLAFATRLAIDEARDAYAYAYYATAIEVFESTAA
jgi:hypothetical protein